MADRNVLGILVRLVGALVLAYLAVALLAAVVPLHPVLTLVLVPVLASLLLALAR